MITLEEAKEAVYAKINAPDPMWKDKPEMIVVSTEDHPVGWLCFWTSRPYHETHDTRFALAGNAPYLVSREDGMLWVTGTGMMFKKRMAELESKLLGRTVEKLKL